MSLRLKDFPCAIACLCLAAARGAVAPAGETRTDGPKMPTILTTWEPTDVEYWGAGNMSARVPFSVPAFDAQELSRERFDALVREGRVFVVRGVGAYTPMRTWNCDFFGSDKEFREVLAQEEYSTGTARAKVKLRDLPNQRKTSAHAEGIPQDPPAPLYFGIKEAEDVDAVGDPSWSHKLLKRVRRNTVVPPFMDPANKESMDSSPEFWFSRGAGSGAKAHVDAHSVSTMSLQLEGRKRWRVAPMARRAVPHVQNLYQDGQIYTRPEKKSWQILQDIILEPEDAVFFPPGMIHETTALEGNGACGASVTYQFDIPSPTTFWRLFLPRLRWTPDVDSLWPLFRAMVSPKLDPTGQPSKGKRLDSALARDASYFLDVDGDGHLTAEELNMVRAAMRAADITWVRANVPKFLRARGLGNTEKVEDEQHLKEMDASGDGEVAIAVRAWELRAHELDAALEVYTASRWTAGLMPDASRGKGAHRDLEL